MTYRDRSFSPNPSSKNFINVRPLTSWLFWRGGTRQKRLATMLYQTYVGATGGRPFSYLPGPTWHLLNRVAAIAGSAVFQRSGLLYNARKYRQDFLLPHPGIRMQSGVPLLARRRR